MAQSDEAENVAAIFDGGREERGHNRRFKKFSSSNDKDNFVLTKLISQQKIRLIQVAAHKPSLDGSWIRSNHKNEYQYLMKFALERISWVARNSAKCEDDQGQRRNVGLFSRNRLCIRTMIS